MVTTTMTKSAQTDRQSTFNDDFEDALTIEKAQKIPGAYRLYARTFLPYDIERVFEFFSDAHNLQEITPPWLDFQVLTPRPIDMHAGALIDYKLKLRGIPLKWRTEIKDWDPPHKFVDEQIRGPYKIWHHEHRFTATKSGTLMEDDVIYKSVGGFLVNRLLIARDVRMIFGHRAKTLKAILAKKFA